MIRRVFYEVEELTEVHLNILEGRRRPLLLAAFRQPQEVRRPPDRHLSTRCRSRAASRS
jgi:hypothetical protein